MLKLIFRSLMVTLVLAVLVCGVYPAIVTGLGRLFFSEKAQGGILYRNGSAVGAQLIGQKFSNAEYFHGRPSAAGAGYDGLNSGGSNLGPNSQKLKETLKSQIDTALKENPSLKAGEVPNDLVMSSGSGLDPHLSPEAAQVQVARISKIRKLTVTQLESLIQEHTQGAQLGFLGKPVVNVLALNLDLDRLYPLR